MNGSCSRRSWLWMIRQGGIAPLLVLLVAGFAFVGLPALHLVVHQREATWEGAHSASWRHPAGPALLPVGPVGPYADDQAGGHAHQPQHEHHPGFGPAAYADADLHAAPGPIHHGGPRHHRHGTGKGSASHGQGAIEHLGYALLGGPAIEVAFLVVPLGASAPVYRAGQISPRFRARANVTRGPPLGDSLLSTRTL